MTNPHSRTALALIDLDGTLTRRDTMFEFVRFASGPGRQLGGALLFLVPCVLYRIRWISSQSLAEMVLHFFFKGWDESRFLEYGRRFAESRLPRLLRMEARRCLKWHRDRQHRIVIVSASFAAWIRPWCEAEGFELIASEYEVADSRLTGRFRGRECSGAEKVRRIQEFLDLSQYASVYAYGDQPEDRPMLALANHSYYRTLTGEPNQDE